jgi:hypothetical protein
VTALLLRIALEADLLLYPSPTRTLYTHTHTHTLSHSHTHTLTHTLSLTHTHSHSHTHSLTHTLSHSHTHSLTHTHTLSLTHSLTHTHTLSLTHTHTCISDTASLPSLLFLLACLPLSCSEYLFTYSVPVCLSVCLFVATPECLLPCFSNCSVLPRITNHGPNCNSSLQPSYCTQPLKVVHICRLSCCGMPVDVFVSLEELCFCFSRGCS